MLACLHKRCRARLSSSGRSTCAVAAALLVENESSDVRQRPEACAPSGQAHSLKMTSPLPSVLTLTAPAVSPSALVGRMRTNTLTRSAGQGTKHDCGCNVAACACLPACSALPASTARLRLPSQSHIPSGLSSPEDGRRLPAEVAVSRVVRRRLPPPPGLVGERLAVPLME